MSLFSQQLVDYGGLRSLILVRAPIHRRRGRRRRVAADTGDGSLCASSWSLSTPGLAIFYPSPLSLYLPSPPHPTLSLSLSLSVSLSVSLCLSFSLYFFLYYL